MLNKTLFLEIDKPNYVPIYTVQYDYNSRFYEITILNNSQPLDLTGIRVIVGGKKPDGKEVFNSCKVLDAKKGLIQLELTEQMNAVNGASEYALELFSADGMLSSQPFKLIVTRSTISKSVESSKELGALKDALNEVQNIDNRFAQTNAQLSQKLDKNGIVTMSNMGQDVKEAMTGGSVAVVGKDTVLTENIVDGQVTRRKTNFYVIDTNGNLIDRDAIVKGIYIDNTGSQKNGNNETDFIPIDINKTYTFNFTSFITFWDENQDFISGYIQGSVSISTPVDLKNIPENAKYVRFSASDSDLETCVFSYKNLFDNSLDTKFKDSKIIIEKEQISNFEVVEDDIKNPLGRGALSFYKISCNGNLFVKSEIIQGGYFSNTGSWINSGNHVSSNLIEIDSTKTYTHNIYSFITFWDENQDFISGYIQGSVSISTPVDLKNIPENAKYVRFSVEKQYVDNTVVALAEIFSLDLINKFYDEDLSVDENNLSSDLLLKINSTSTTIAGKTINFLGDSITYGFDGTNSTRVSKPYPTIVGEILGAKINNYGMSGSTIGGDGKTSTEYNVLGNTPMNIRYADMANADYVLVLGGVNDYTVDRRIPLGIKGDTTNLTFYGALKILIEGLIRKYPNSRIGFITPLRKMNDHNLNVYGNHLKEYRNAIIEMCEEYSVPVLDLFSKGGCYAHVSTDWRNSNLPDGLHPNQEFYYKMAVQISSFIESI